MVGVKFHHGHVEGELLDEWWAEAGMCGFVATRAAFRAKPHRALPTLEVPIADVEPVERQLSHGVFNDSDEFGTARERVVFILSGFRDDVAIPPVELVRATSGGAHRYRVHDGAHRFYCSIAAGFRSVPAIDVTDELAKIGPPIRTR